MSRTGGFRYFYHTAVPFWMCSEPSSWRFKTGCWTGYSWWIPMYEKEYIGILAPDWRYELSGRFRTIQSPCQAPTVPLRVIVILLPVHFVTINLATYQDCNDQLSIIIDRKIRSAVINTHLQQSSIAAKPHLPHSLTIYLGIYVAYKYIHGLICHISTPSNAHRLHFRYRSLYLAFGSLPGPKRRAVRIDVCPSHQSLL